MRDGSTTFSVEAAERLPRALGRRKFCTGALSGDGFVMLLERSCCMGGTSPSCSAMGVEMLMAQRSYLGSENTRMQHEGQQEGIGMGVT